jgi:hypothetical protein
LSDEYPEYCHLLTGFENKPSSLTSVETDGGLWLAARSVRNVEFLEKERNKVAE